MALGSAMIDDGSRVFDDRPEILVDCGYTYFGQFVAHDLTKDVSSVDEAWRKEPEELENLQTPKLDLGVLYGDGPESSGELYEEDRVRLKVGLFRARPAANTMAVSMARVQRLSPDPSRPESLQKSVWRESIDDTLGHFFYSDRVLRGSHAFRTRDGAPQLSFFLWAGDALAANFRTDAGPRGARR